MTNPPDQPPNILFLMPDQLRADALGYAGHPVYRIPNIDRLAREGVAFTRAYCNSPLCMPARASVVSGVYPHNHHIQGNSGHLPADDETFAQHLVQAGYRTAYVGKIHFFPDDAGRDLIAHEPYVRSRGFQDVHEVPGPAAMTKTVNYLSRHWQQLGLLEPYQADFQRRQQAGRAGEAAAWASPLPVDEFLDSYVGARALDWLRAYDGPSPFFLWVGFGGPHAPWDAPGEYATMYDPQQMADPLPAAEPGPWLPERVQQQMASRVVPPERQAQWRQVARERAANYGGKVSLIDHWVGQLLAELDRRDLARNTLVVFFSDHGEMAGDHNRYQKSVFFEGAVRVPLALRWPAGLPSGARSDALVEQVDLFPTVLAAAGLPPSPRAQGHSLLPLARGQQAPPRTAAYAELGREIMMRTETHKYAVDAAGEPAMLYDLQHDPQEQCNLAGHPDTRALEASLRDQLLRWLVSTQVERT